MASTLSRISTEPQKKPDVLLANCTALTQTGLDELRAELAAALNDPLDAKQKLETTKVALAKLGKAKQTFDESKDYKISEVENAQTILADYNAALSTSTAELNGSTPQETRAVLKAIAKTHLDCRILAEQILAPLRTATERQGEKELRRKAAAVRTDRKDDLERHAPDAVQTGDTGDLTEAAKEANDGLTISENSRDPDEPFNLDDKSVASFLDSLEGEETKPKPSPWDEDKPAKPSDDPEEDQATKPIPIGGIASAAATQNPGAPRFKEAPAKPAPVKPPMPRQARGIETPRRHPQS